MSDLRLVLCGVVCMNVYANYLRYLVCTTRAATVAILLTTPFSFPTARRRLSRATHRCAQ
jgi:hypothetical protein